MQVQLLQEIMNAAPSRSGDMINLCAGLQMSGDEWGVLREVLQTDVRPVCPIMDP
jgi:hypothetical protein